METKQVIVMRRYYPDPSDPNKTRKIRTGKMIAQACHASMSFLTKEAKTFDLPPNKKIFHTNITIKQDEWLESSFKKVVCYVDTELEIHGLAALANEYDIENHIITDSGHTEFSEPTVTCIAIGPDRSDLIDTITGNLPLL